MRVLIAIAGLFMFINSVSAAIEVEVGRDGAKDDYLCWGLVEGRIRWKGPGPVPGKVALSSKPVNPTTAGALVFVDAATPSSDRKETLTVALQPQEAWTRFLIAGSKASTEDKDVAIAVSDEAGNSLATHPVMVRVRKNAEQLTDAERDRFLNAFAKAGKRENQFDIFWRLHTNAGAPFAHDVAFLPWHRTLLLHLERLLQAEDPSVALPYWEFDKKAPKLFSLDFLGRVGDRLANPAIVEFSPSNPLANGWGVTNVDLPAEAPQLNTPLTRLNNGDENVGQGLNKDFMRETTQIPCCGGFGSDIWFPYHGAAHVHISGLIGDINRSPGDPLFFLLHANTDRGWAAWQRFHDRFNRDKVEAYGLQGAHSAGASRPLGNFEEDTMWPWDGVVRPNQQIVFPVGDIHLPPNPGPGDGIMSNPQVGENLDYLDLANDGGNQGFCYDNIPAGIGTVPDF